MVLDFGANSTKFDIISNGVKIKGNSLKINYGGENNT